MMFIKAINKHMKIIWIFVESNEVFDGIIYY